MPHNPYKERNPHGGKDQRPSTPEQQSTLTELGVRHTAHGKQHNEPRIPFYDDPNHVAYGWQQMATLPDFPDLSTLRYRAQDDPLLSPGNRPQTWPVELLQSPTKVEQSGFNPHPRRGQGPRRPPPLIQSGDRNEHSLGSRRKFKPFADRPFTEHKDLGAGADDSSGDRQTRLALASKDANQKLRIGQTREKATPLLKLTEDLRMTKRQPRSKKLMVDELESPQHPDRQIERMPSLTEEPAPLTVRKERVNTSNSETRSRSSTLDQARILRAEQEKGGIVQLASDLGYLKSKSENPDGHRVAYPDSSLGCEGMTVVVREVDGIEDEGMESLMTAITEQLSAFAMGPRLEFEHRSAVPRSLDLDAITAAKEKRKLSGLGTRSDGVIKTGERGRFHEAKIGSVESFATGASLEFESLSAPDSSEHNGMRRKWYKGFRRSE